MGIKHYFQWFLKSFPECHMTLPADEPIPITIDTLGLDLNGLFHPAAQKVFKYGAHKPAKRLLTSSTPSPPLPADIDMFKETCCMIDDLVRKVRPRKRLLLCVDGVSGCAKMSQQRQRRFRSAMENSSGGFDSCSLTPGTEFMHQLNQYILWYIHHKLNTDEVWAHLDVFFSSEKTPGEGEHSIMTFIRKYGEIDEIYCINGLDADLFMLSLALHKPRVYIIREDMYTPNKRYIINIGMFSEKLAARMKRDALETNVIDDFVFLCFMVGNDFLPQLPGVEIFNGGIDMMIDMYIKAVNTNVGDGLLHDTTFQINKDVLMNYLQQLSLLEDASLKEKYKKRAKYFPDPLLEKYYHESIEWELTTGEPLIDSDFEGYKQAYYQAHFEEGVSVERICHEYLKGLQWVIHYYTLGIPDWEWYYPYHYGPFVGDLMTYLSTYTFTPYPQTSACIQFQQLLAVLSPKSQQLIPTPLRSLMIDELKEYYPDEFKVDISGKRAEWEGLVLLPVMNFNRLKEMYRTKEKELDEKDKRRNKQCVPKLFWVDTSKPKTLLKTRYGTIESYVQSRRITNQP